jgi:hypothetical protein
MQLLKFENIAHNYVNMVHTTSLTIKSIWSPIMWRLNFFLNVTHLWIRVIQLMVDWSPPLIWWWNLVYLVIKCKPYMSIFHWGVYALCCLTLTIAICLGGEGWNLYVCLNFRLSYCICNWCWISIIALKVEFIVEYINYINQTYCSCA